MRVLAACAAIFALLVLCVSSSVGSRALAATCTSSVGPGIPAPQFVPSGIDGFHASWYGQSGYPTLCPGERSTAVVAYYNSGTRGWVSGRLGEMAFLGTWGPLPGQDQPSTLGGDGTNGSPATGWPRYNRVAAQPADYVGPNQVAWFQFTIQAPQQPGVYRLYIRPLVEGAQWMEDFGVFWQVTVKEPEPSPSPGPTPTPTPTIPLQGTIEVSPSTRATLATGAVRNYTVTLQALTGCVHLALIDGRTPRADGSLRDLERDSAGFAVGDEKADFSTNAFFSSINGNPVSSSVIECVGGPETKSLTFSVSSFTTNAFVRPIVYRDIDDDRKLRLDPFDRPAEPSGVGGAIRFLPANAPNGVQKVSVVTITTDERLFTDVGQVFHWDDNDRFFYVGAAITRAQFEEVLSVGDFVTVTYRVDPAESSSFEITGDAGYAAPQVSANVGSFHGTGLLSDVRLTITEPASNADGVVYAVSRSSSGTFASCGPSSGPYAQIGTITIPTDQDVVYYDDRDVASGTYCYYVAAVAPLGPQPPGGYGGLATVANPVPTVFQPSSLDIRIATATGVLTKYDAGDVIKLAFNEPMRPPPAGVYVRARDADGTLADFICGTNATCTASDAPELVGTVTYAAGSVITMTLTGDPKIVGEGSVIGLQVAATVVFASGFIDPGARGDWNLGGSPDLLINYPPAR